MEKAEQQSFDIGVAFMNGECISRIFFLQYLLFVFFFFLPSLHNVMFLKARGLSSATCENDRIIDSKYDKHNNNKSGSHSLWRTQADARPNWMKKNENPCHRRFIDTRRYLSILLFWEY